MDNTYVRIHAPKGRCVHAARAFRKGLVLEGNLVITYPFLPEGHPLLEWSMAWSDTEDCIALGNINLLNHSDNPNCEVKNDMVLGRKYLYALQDIAEGEELTIKYKCELWFKPV